MKDRSAGIIMTIIFGLYGIVAVVLAWSLPSLQSERLMTTLVGISGIIIAAISARGLRRKDNNESENRIPAEVEAENKS